jgi:acetyl esterase/lipase
MLPSSLVALTLALASQHPAEFKFEIRNDVVYSKVGDRELLLDAYLPEKDGPTPAVLVVHGGAWRMGNRKQLRGYAEALAKTGFVCFAIDYRLAPQHKFPAQIEDCRSAVRWIRTNAARYEVDPLKLGAIGYSAGGHLVSLLGTTGEAPSKENGNVDTRLQVVVAGGAPTDFRWFPDRGKWCEFLMGGTLDTVPEKFFAASSSAFADKDDPPTFFFNGTEDSLVPLPWSQSCFGALKAAGVKTEFHKIEGAGHMQAARKPEALEKAYEFLKAELLPPAVRDAPIPTNKQAHVLEE